MTEAPATDLLADDAFMAALLDTVIPPGEPMPGAGTLGLATDLRAQLARNAAFQAPVQAGLAAVQAAACERDPGGLASLDADARHDTLAGAMAQQPVLGMLPLLVYMVYYVHPRVLEALGQPGRPPFPGGHEIQATDESLLKKLRQKAS